MVKKNRVMSAGAIPPLKDITPHKHHPNARPVSVAVGERKSSAMSSLVSRYLEDSKEISSDISGPPSISVLENERKLEIQLDIDEEKLEKLSERFYKVPPDFEAAQRHGNANKIKYNKSADNKNKHVYACC